MTLRADGYWHWARRCRSWRSAPQAVGEMAATRAPTPGARRRDRARCGGAGGWWADRRRGPRGRRAVRCRRARTIGPGGPEQEGPARGPAAQEVPLHTRRESDIPPSPNQPVAAHLALRYGTLVGLSGGAASDASHARFEPKRRRRRDVGQRRRLPSRGGRGTGRRHRDDPGPPGRAGADPSRAAGARVEDGGGRHEPRSARREPTGPPDRCRRRACPAGCSAPAGGGRHATRRRDPVRSRRTRGALERAVAFSESPGEKLSALRVSDAMTRAPPTRTRGHGGAIASVRPPKVMRST